MLSVLIDFISRKESVLQFQRSVRVIKELQDNVLSATQDTTYLKEYALKETLFVPGQIIMDNA